MAFETNQRSMLESKSITDYISIYHPEWCIEMPEGCPPKDICIPTEHLFYRFAVNKDSYSEDDFKSYAELCPNKEWGEMLPLAVGLSILDDEKKAVKSMKLPYMKKFKGIIALMLNAADGVVKQTGVHKSHYTWWRTKSFNMSNLNMLDYDKPDNKEDT